MAPPVAQSPIAETPGAEIRVAEKLPDRVLGPAALRALSTRSDAAGAARTAIHVLALLLTGAAVALAPSFWVWPAMFALGLVQVALFAPAHECMHRTAFLSGRANAIVGWLAACPSLLNLDFYRAFHLAHHRHTQVQGQDPELDATAPDTLGGYLVRLSAMSFWRLRLKTVADAWRGDLSAYPYITPATAPRIILSVRAMSALMAAAALASAAIWGWQTPFKFWILPQLLAQPPLRAYLLAEHTGCAFSRNGLENTRTTHTNALVRLLMWEMPFHAEHHLYPSIPFHRLADAHARIAAKLGHVQPGYARWNAGHLRRLVRGGG